MLVLRADGKPLTSQVRTTAKEAESLRTAREAEADESPAWLERSAKRNEGITSAFLHPVTAAVVLRGVRVGGWHHAGRDATGMPVHVCDCNTGPHSRLQHGPHSRNTERGYSSDG